MDQTTIAVIAAVVLVVLALLYVYLRHAKTSPKKVTKTNMDLDALFKCLGTKENITAVSANGSKITFVLKDTKRIDAKGLKTLGASGIVAKKDNLTVIFGKASEALAFEIGQLL